MEGKLGLFGLIKESLRIPFKNPNFFISAFIISAPLFCSLTIYEIIFQKTLLEIGNILKETLSTSHNPYDIFHYDYEALLDFEKWVGRVSRKFLPLVLIYLGICHFLELLCRIAVVELTSMIYKEEKGLNLKGIFSRFINETRVKGPLITSIYVLLLAFLISFGLVSLAPYMLILYSTSIFVFILPFFVVFICLLVKYIEWSVIWEMGIVISILEEKYGDVAIIISSNISRGSRFYGSIIMLVFFIWRLGLRLSCFYVGFERRGGELIISTMVHIGFVVLGIVLKWVAFVVYFYDCKKKSSQRKIDSEEKGAASSTSV